MPAGMNRKRKKKTLEQRDDDGVVRNENMFVMVVYNSDAGVQRKPNLLVQGLLHTVVPYSCWWGAPLRLFCFTSDPNFWKSISHVKAREGEIRLSGKA